MIHRIRWGNNIKIDVKEIDYGLDLSASRQSLEAVCCEFNNETFMCNKRRVILDQGLKCIFRSRWPLQNQL